MMDKRLLALVPEALWHVLATVAWQWAGLVGNVALVWVIARVASSLVAGAAALQLALPLLAVGIVLRVVAACTATRPPSGRPSRTSCAMLVPGCCLATRS